MDIGAVGLKLVVLKWKTPVLPLLPACSLHCSQHAPTTRPARTQHGYLPSTGGRTDRPSDRRNRFRYSFTQKKKLVGKSNYNSQFLILDRVGDSHCEPQKNGPFLSNPFA